MEICPVVRKLRSINKPNKGHNFLIRLWFSFSGRKTSIQEKKCLFPFRRPVISLNINMRKVENTVENVGNGD